MSKTEAIERLRVHLAGLFDSRFEGTDGADYARAQGFADGYMQAMNDLAVAMDRELLEVVNEERRSAAHRADNGRTASPSAPILADFA